MKIGILSDTHNNNSNTLAALNVFRQRAITQLIHCGDVTRSEMLDLFAGFQLTLVEGNGDDPVRLRLAIQALPHIYFAGADATLTFENVSVAACHGHDEGRLAGLANSGLFTWVFRGHSHKRGIKRALNNMTQILNPGALGGRRVEPRSIAIVDLANNVAEFVEM